MNLKVLIKSCILLSYIPASVEILNYFKIPLWVVLVFAVFLLADYVVDLLDVRFKFINKQIDQKKSNLLMFIFGFSSLVLVYITLIILK